MKKEKTDVEQPQATHAGRKGGDRQRLRYIDGDFQMYMRTKEKKTKEQEKEEGNSNELRQDNGSDGRAPGEKKGMSSSSSKGRNVVLDVILISDTWRQSGAEMGVKARNCNVWSGWPLLWIGSGSKEQLENISVLLLYRVDPSFEWVVWKNGLFQTCVCSSCL